MSLRQSDDLNTNILGDLPRPPPLMLVPSASAPVSRVGTPPPILRKHRRASWSAPVSPLAKKKQPLSPIVRDVLASPARAIRKRGVHVTFNKFNPRFDHQREVLCAVHSYSTMEKELAVLPSHTVGGVKFSGVPRIFDREAACPIHSYSTMEKELAVLPSNAVGGVKFGGMPRDCLMPKRANCPVNVYAEAKSSLNTTGGAPFAMSREGRDTFQQTGRALAPVHAYAAPSSTLRSTGTVPFGSTAPRASLMTSVSRTGLLVATSTPRKAGMPVPQRAPRSTLPKLVPPLEQPTVTEKHGGDNSPREVEAVLIA